MYPNDFKKYLMASTASLSINVPSKATAEDTIAQLAKEKPKELQRIYTHWCTNEILKTMSGNAKVMNSVPGCKIEEE